MPQLPRILFLNASLAGNRGNTAALLDRAARKLRSRARVHTVTFTESDRYADIRPELTRADGFIFATGTHWDSWSSLLQRFLEEATPDEGRDPWFGKPAGALVTMHSVGGKQVLSRLQGVLSTFGCLLPPMSGLVYSYANQMALRSEAPLTDDLWTIEDVDIVAWNILTAALGKTNYQRWSVDRHSTTDRWIESP